MMGKGDRKTAKGKRYNASYGNARPHSISKASVDAAAPLSNKRAPKAQSPRTVVKKTVTKAI
ncbi:30S ribosomal protein THX [Xylella fastidiosa]|nr:30S ribosomal protein THX [Xylella fastidiosa]